MRREGLIALKERAKVEEALLSDTMIKELKAQKQTEETKVRYRGYRVREED